MPYTQGNWEGFLATDTVTIPSMNITVGDATLSCITQSENFFINASNWQGILGLGYSQIARVLPYCLCMYIFYLAFISTFQPDPTAEPLFDAIVRNGIVNDSFSLQMCGQLSSGTTEGSLVRPSLLFHWFLRIHSSGRCWKILEKYIFDNVYLYC